MPRTRGDFDLLIRFIWPLLVLHKTGAFDALYGATGACQLYDFGSRDHFLDRRLISRCVTLVICQAALSPVRWPGANSDAVISFIATAP